MTPPRPAPEAPARGEAGGSTWSPPPLPAVDAAAVELITVRLPLTRPVASSRGIRSSRDVLLVHLRGEPDGWAECPVEPEPTYDGEYTAAAAAVIEDHLAPRLVGVGDLGAARHALGAVRGHHSARAALEAALLDAQLRAGGRSLAEWLGADRTTVAVGATVGMVPAEPGAALDAVGAAVATGAARVRVKIAPGRVAAVAALRRAWPDLALQVDANGAFDPDDADHVAELAAIDELGLSCIEQPFAPDDLVAHAALARRARTPVALDESITSPGALRSALALGACSVVCAKPARVGGPVAVRALLDVAVAAGVDLFVGGMFETGVGRALNLAVAALAGATLPADADPRGWFDPDLAPPAAPGPTARSVAVPSSPGAVPAPDPDVVRAHLVARREVSLR